MPASLSLPSYTLVTLGAVKLSAFGVMVKAPPAKAMDVKFCPPSTVNEPTL